MRNPRQVALSALIVAAALAVVAMTVHWGDGAPPQPAAQGHDHAAMLAGGGAGAGGAKAVSLDAAQARRIGVTWATVERGVLDAPVATVGTVAWNETTLASVNPKVTGWVEKLHVDFTGAPVRKGEPLLEVYSPQLVTAQEELALAVRLVREAGEGRAAENANELLASARRRLAYWDVPADEIRRVESTGQVSKTLTLRAPASGVVVEKNVVEGDRIMPGMTLYRIADPSTVWIEADVFERDLGRVHEGQSARVSSDAWPGRTFPGRVAYVYPTVSLESRTGRVRVELGNPGGLLKPGMYARVAVDAPGGAPALLVPRSAVLATGRRSLVFVLGPDGGLVPTEVVEGRAEEERVEIVSGLKEGDRVVASAAFLVDAESSLGALTAGKGGEGGMGGMNMPGMGGGS